QDSESYCSDQLCVNTLSQAVRNESVFADVDSIQLSDIDVSLFRYSLPVDVPRLVMMEGRPAGMESAIDLRFYAVYIIDTALLLILLLLFGSIVTALKSQLVIDANQNDRLRILCGFIDFLSRMLHDLLNGTRRLLIDTGVLMENEYSAFGPLTTVIKDERERLERLCNDEDDVALLWDDQMFGLAALNQSLLRNCRLNRIDIPFDTSNHPLPRLERSLENGEYLYFAMPRSTARKTVERLNLILTSIFTHDLRNSLHARRYIPARSHGSSFDAYRATFPTSSKLPLN
ncbi:hypothetical protein PENTCL1PPCAC_17296, partial [Pristionchus entomophagus]